MKKFKSPLIDPVCVREVFCSAFGVRRKYIPYPKRNTGQRLSPTPQVIPARGPHWLPRDGRRSVKGNSGLSSLVMAPGSCSSSHRIAKEKTTQQADNHREIAYPPQSFVDSHQSDGPIV